MFYWQRLKFYSHHLSPVILSRSSFISSYIFVVIIHMWLSIYYGYHSSLFALLRPLFFFSYPLKVVIHLQFPVKVVNNLYLHFRVFISSSLFKGHHSFIVPSLMVVLYLSILRHLLFFFRVLVELVAKMTEMRMDKTELGCLR